MVQDSHPVKSTLTDIHFPGVRDQFVGQARRASGNGEGQLPNAQKHSVVVAHDFNNLLMVIMGYSDMTS